MKRRVLTVLGGLGAVVVLLVAGVVGFSSVRWDRAWQVDEPALRASADPAVVERGRYLVYGPAHCAYCHTTQDEWPALDAGEAVPLSGGGRFVIDLGVYTAPNLTPDPETGIGAVGDGALARMIRHNVRSSGRVAVPFMEFQNLSDEDVVAVLSYLRAQPAVRNEVPDVQITLLGKVVSTFLLKPTFGEPPAHAPAEEATVERGGYLVNNLANCVGCHSPRSMTDGSYTGPRLSGGMSMALDGDPKRGFITPNLTPDPETGRIARWTEDQFVARFRDGTPRYRESHMPWRAFQRMSETDLRAIHRYLRTVEPVENATPDGIVVF